MDSSDKDQSKIAFFDVETTVPIRRGQGYAILEFGAILVCPKKLEELESYSSLVKPSSLSLLNALSIRCNGITPDAVASAPTFADIADRVFDLLQGKIWAGHNILRFDCARIREAFLEIGRPVPEPKGVIDSLSLLTQKFGRRAGDMKMATLATYFGLGKQVHRSLDDVRMNLEVLKYCATVLFLESSLPDIFTEKSWVSPNATTRSRNNGENASPLALKLNKKSPTQSLKFEICEPSSFASTDQVTEDKDVPFPSGSNIGDTILNLVETDTPVVVDSFSMDVLRDEIPATETLTTETRTFQDCDENQEGVFLEPEEVMTSSINASLVPFYRGSQRIRVFHRNVGLQLFCRSLRVRWGLSSRFVDHAGRPRLSFVVDAHPSLCGVLDVCDDVAWRLSVEGGSGSEWRSTVIRKNGFINSPTIRISLPIAVKGGVCSYSTGFYKRKPCGGMESLVFDGVNPTDIEVLIVPGTFVSAYLSLEPYDFQLNAGIRLVANKLIL